MKVDSVRNYNLNNQKPQNGPDFKGGLAIGFWDAVARGGFAASFTIQDMTGTNLPRTYSALHRNKEITGKNNYKAAAEVAIREFITGPSMVTIPMIVLAISKKASGSANDVPLENIGVFSDQMKGVLKSTPLDCAKNNTEYAQNIKGKFYEKMFALTLNEDLTKNAPSPQAKELADMLQKYDEAPKKGFFKQLLKKDIIDADGNKIISKDQLYDDIVTKITSIKKMRTDDYSSLMVSDMAGNLNKKQSVTSLVKDFSNFGNDVKKTMQNSAGKAGSKISTWLDYDSFMDAFKERRTGSKFFTNVAMVAAAALFMVNIPKLYTLHKTNPETDAFREQCGEAINANQ